MRITNAFKFINDKLAKAATARGERLYSSVTPCSNGHLIRLVSTNKCYECKCLSDKAYRDRRDTGQKRRQLEHNRKYFNKKYHTDLQFREDCLLKDRVRRSIKQVEKLLAILETLK